jgi:hypothetical protein
VEDHLEIYLTKDYLKEDHLIKAQLEDHHPIHMYGWPIPDLEMFMPPWYPLVATRYEPTSKFHT